MQTPSNYQTLAMLNLMARLVSFVMAFLPPNLFPFFKDIYGLMKNSEMEPSRPQSKGWGMTFSSSPKLEDQ